MNDNEKIPTILDGKYFKIVEKIPKNEDVNIKAKCQLCSGNASTLSGSMKVVSNFIKHLKRKHPINLETYRNDSKVSKSSTNSVAGQPSTSRQLTMFEVTGRVEQSKVNSLVLSLIIEKMLPFTLVEAKPFINLIEYMSNNKIKLPNRRQLVSSVNEKYESMVADLKRRLSNVDSVSSTADVWSEKKRSFLGVTCHWVDSETFEHCSFALACQRFKGSHTYDKIAQELQQIYTRFVLKSSKITMCVTDNGSNFVKAFKEFGVEPEHELSDADEEIEESHENLEFSELVPEDSAEEVIFQLPKHHRCASHTLSLVATTDVNKAVLQAAQKRIKLSTLSKCSALWNKGNQPKSAEIIMDVCERRLKPPCVTRWNSMFDSLEVLQKLGLSKLQDLCKKLGMAVFNENEFLFIEEYLTILRPIAEALDVLQGEKDMYFGNVIPVVRSTMKRLSNIVDINNGLRLTNAIHKSVIDGFEERFRAFIDQDEDQVLDAMIATATMPCFKMKPILKHKHTILRTKIDSLVNRKSVKPISTQVKPNIGNLNEFYDFSDDDDHPVENEYSRFLSDSSIEFSSLNNYPIVKEIFLEYNAALPSSAPVERLFSFAGIILKDRRCNLNDSNFEKLLLLKSNAKLNI